jgi:flagellar hook-associated protein 2
MATDYLSALNVGSGLNTTEIIDSLVDAERVPKEKIINTAKEEKTVSISAFAQVKTELSGLNASLDVISSVSGLAEIQSGTSVQVEITDSNLASAFRHQIEVDNLATAQTLVFSGFSSREQALGAGSLTISFGAWDADTGVFTADPDQSDSTITIADGQDSLAEIMTAINTADIGATASIIDTGDGSFNLMLRSETGASSALRVTASETIPGSGLAGLDYTSYDATKEAVVASDASFTLDGVTVTRQTNDIDDLFDGIKITLSQTTSSAETIGARWNSATALAAMSVLVESVNGFRATLTELSRRGSDGVEGGPLAGDPLARSILSRVRSFTTQPIEGYGEDPVYLANFGLKTARDGTITLDEDVFTDAFEADPSSFNAVIKNSITTSESGITASVFGNNWTGGNYALSIDDNGDADIGGRSMTLSSGVYSISEGNPNGLRLDVPDGVTSATIYMGRSMVSQLQQYIDTMLARNNDIDNVINRYNSDISDYDDKLSALDDRMSNLRERYVTKFAAMNNVLASVKKTQEGLDNMMDSWRGLMNN